MCCTSTCMPRCTQTYSTLVLPDTVQYMHKQLLIYIRTAHHYMLLRTYMLICMHMNIVPQCTSHHPKLILQCSCNICCINISESEDNLKVVKEQSSIWQ